MGRIKALRVAVVARSQLREKEVITGVDMTCNNVSGSNANGPCAWRDTTASPAPIIDLSADPDWQRYRYRVYETIVPLRNVMWQSF
jgi:type IV pilus assembly protein PilW